MDRKSLNFLKRNKFFRYPKMIQFEITLRCPFNCSQCYKKNLKKKDIDYEYLKCMIEHSIMNGTEIITLNGGEPLLYPNILELLTYIGEMGVFTNVFSSGYNLNSEIVNILKKYSNINFYVSLNGSTEQINSTSREGFDVSLNAIDILSRSQVDYGINWVARHDNIFDFPNMLSLCHKYNVSYLSITSNKITGKNIMESPVTKDDLIILADFINSRDCLQTRILIESCFSMLSIRVNAKKNSFSAHCYAGISNCTVNCDGTFQPCTHLKYPEKYDSLEKYWIDSKILSQLREIPSNKLKPCCNCDYNKICSLCRAMSTVTYCNLSAGLDECLYV